MAATAMPKRRCGTCPTAKAGREFQWGPLGGQETEASALGASVKWDCRRAGLLYRVT